MAEVAPLPGSSLPVPLDPSWRVVFAYYRCPLRARIYLLTSLRFDTRRPVQLFPPPAFSLRIILSLQASPAMYATGYHVPDPLRPIDPRLAGSLSRADPYASPHNAWQPPAPAQYRDLPPIPTGSGQQRVPSPLSSPSIPSGDSPDAYFAPHHHFHHQHQMAPQQHPQDGQWAQMSAHQRTCRPSLG